MKQRVEEVKGDLGNRVGKKKVGTRPRNTSSAEDARYLERLETLGTEIKSIAIKRVQTARSRSQVVVLLWFIHEINWFVIWFTSCCTALPNWREDAALWMGDIQAIQCFLWVSQQGFTPQDMPWIFRCLKGLYCIFSYRKTSKNAESLNFRRVNRKYSR